MLFTQQYATLSNETLEALDKRIASHVPSKIANDNIDALIGSSSKHGLVMQEDGECEDGDGEDGDKATVGMDDNTMVWLRQQFPTIDFSIREEPGQDINTK